MNVQRYPIGIQSFTEIIEKEYVYVDKTEFIHTLEENGKYYFLSRPRRFGKSLFVNTLEAYYQGRRELFKGLAIEKHNPDWIERPVFKFVLNGIDPNDENGLPNYLDNKFSQLESLYGSVESELSFALRFEGLLRRAFQLTGQQCVILFDEYDAPLLSTLDRPELNERYRETIKSVFTMLKNADDYIHLAFITGVSRFNHTSLFSGANNVPDVSFYEDFAAICGITEEELSISFAPSIEEFARLEGISPEEMHTRLKAQYDGYHFARRSPDIFNPYSIVQAFKSDSLDDFWFGSGTPAYLVEALQKNDFFLPELDCIEVPFKSLKTKEAFLNNPISLLYETGYLTIKGYEKEDDTCILGLPNQEVERGLSNALLPIYSHYKDTDIDSWEMKMKRAVKSGDAERFMNLLQTFLEGNPYSNTIAAQRETYFKNNLYLIFKILGFRTETEKETCCARTDVVLETSEYIYFFELKMNRTAEEAIRQIDTRGYPRIYAEDPRTIIKIGANYSSDRNNIDSWLIATEIKN